MLCIHNGLTWVVTIGLVFVTDLAGKNNNLATLLVIISCLSMILLMNG